MKKNKYVIARLTGLTTIIYLVGAIASGVLTYLLVVNVMVQQNHEKLESVLASRANAVEGYFQLTRKQIGYLAASDMAVQAMAEFSDGFAKLREDLDQDVENGGAAYRDLVDYYTREFSERLPDAVKEVRSAESYIPRSESGKLAQWVYIVKNPNPTGRKQALHDSPFESKYEEVHKQFHPKLDRYMKSFGFRDLFLVNCAGDLIYSNVKEVDFATNVIHGVFAGSGLSIACQAALAASASDEVAVVDFKNYEPSYGQPASFLSAPIFAGGVRTGVVVLQLDPDRLNSVVFDLHGMGESGEAYVVGDDLLMRTDSRFSEESSILRQMVDTTAAKSVLRGRSGAIVCNDYRGVEVLSHYTPLAIAGLTWGILAEVDYADLIAPAERLAVFTVGILVVTLIIIAMVSLATLRLCVMRPLKQLLMIAGEFRDGNLSARVYVIAEDEFAALADSHNQMAAAIQKHIVSLEHSLSEIKELRGLLPICAACKSIRDDDGYFKTVETYLVGRSNVEFTHTICQECVPRIYPELSGQIGQDAE